MNEFMMALSEVMNEFMTHIAHENHDPQHFVMILNTMLPPHLLPNPALTLMFNLQSSPPLPSSKL